MTPNDSLFRGTTITDADEERTGLLALTKAKDDATHMSTSVCLECREIRFAAWRTLVRRSIVCRSH